MNIFVNNLSDWFKANKLSLNISNSNYIIFSKLRTFPENLNLTKPRFLMSGTLIFSYKTNKNSYTHSKLCTC